ncbi:MAG: hypothetical protein KDD55_10405, partial [Bdellovibrionales bacterium]|nr:hypothetical protein [Bdellovibrionales bacterium]
MLRATFVFFLFSCFPTGTFAQISHPLLFVTQVPKPEDFANIVSTFGNHRGTLESAPRGGDLWIRYPDGTLKNLTQSAGFGKSGFQGSQGIAVRDPAVHWSGERAIFSMVIGSPDTQYESESYRFQLYEVTGLGLDDTPVIEKVPYQPSTYNNVMPTYGADGSILFISDKPYNGADHLYPQLDEYESTPTNTGLWKLDPLTGTVKILDHSPSGDFDPFVDSFGRVLFTRWDHMQRDQQKDAGSFGAYNMSSEAVDAFALSGSEEIYPESRFSSDGPYGPVQGHRFNHFTPWMCEHDGTGLETINHIGRHELIDYFTQSFLSDSSLDEFLGESASRLNSYPIENLFHLSEDPLRPGVYVGINGPEFYTHTSGQIVELYGPEGVSADEMFVEPLTHPDTASFSSSPSSEHSGLYRNPIFLTTGELVASHTTETREDENIGSRAHPQSRYMYRLQLVSQQGDFVKATSPLTTGISKTVSYYDPDVLVSYSGPLWELQPVEVVSRSVPLRNLPKLPSIERSVFEAVGVSLDEFQSYLQQINMALIVSRNITTRDMHDTQQPFNLRVSNGGSETVGDSGNVYEVAFMGFLQGDLIRRYSNLHGGVRPIAQRVQTLLGPSVSSATVLGSTPISADGSVAVIVPAGKALTWELLSPSGQSVVKERYW